MKVMLDLERLKEEGKITAAEYDKLLQFSIQETGTLAFNILVSFGVIAVSGATLALVPSPYTSIILGILITIVGLSPLRNSPKWQLMTQICSLVGALLMAGGLIWSFSGQTNAWVLVTIIFFTLGILVRHGLLIVLGVLALSCSVGAGTMYGHASYFVFMEQPSLTIIVFSLLGVLSYHGSLHLPSAYKHLAVLAARTCLFLINMGFWIGSLWGDALPNHSHIPEMTFIILWALILIGVGIWAVFVGKRWALNICAIFGAIHFYTQWFERLGATPGSVLFAGIIALLFALALRYLNQTLSEFKEQEPRPHKKRT